MAETAQKKSGLLDQIVETTLRWTSHEDLPLHHAPQLRYQRINNTVYLTFGQISFPVEFELGSHAEVSVRPVARIEMTLDEFKVIQGVLAKQDTTPYSAESSTK